MADTAGIRAMAMRDIYSLLGSIAIEPVSWLVYDVISLSLRREKKSDIYFGHWPHTVVYITMCLRMLQCLLI